MTIIQRRGIGLLAAALAFCRGGCQKTESAEAAPAAAAPSQPPAAAPAEPTEPPAGDEPAGKLEVKLLKSADEYHAALAELKGKVVLVNMWATWCGPCVEEFPSLVKVRDKYADRDLVLLTISADFDTDLEKVTQFLTEHKVTEHAYLNVAEDSNEFINGVLEDLSGELPATLIYDRDGKLAKWWEGEKTYEEFDEAVAPLFAEQSGRR